MTTWKKILAGVLIAALVIGLLGHMGHVFNFGKENKVLAADAVVSNDGVYKTIDKSGVLGSEGNPFVVLEIVPNELQAQFGYLVGGQEPIDINAVIDDNSTSGDRKKEIRDTLNTWFSIEKTDLVAKDFFESFTEAEWEDNKRMYIEDAVVNADRYARYVPAANGDYKYNFLEEMIEAEKNPDGTLTETGEPTYIHLSDAEFSIEKFYDYFSVLYYEEVTDGGIDEETGEPIGEVTAINVTFCFNPDEEITVTVRVNDGMIQLDNTVMNIIRRTPEISSALDLTIIDYDGEEYIRTGEGPWNVLEIEGADFRKQYSFYFEHVTDHSGDYKLEYLNYAESSRISKDIADNPFLRSMYVDRIVLKESEYISQPEIIGPPPEQKQVYTFYKWKLVNNELFKKFALGLSYKNDKYSEKEDISSFSFLGWFYEPECVNRFNESAAIKKNTTVYAKWSEHYAGRDEYYSVSFDANASDEETVDGFDFSATIDYLAKGSKIVAPMETPHRKNYTFTGWYKDEACLNAVSFPLIVNESTTLYAGWTYASGEYSISFNANAPIGSGVTGVPASKVVVRNNNRTEEDLSLKPADPERYGYIFGGWYWDSSCSTEYDFSKPITYGGSEITLYALWVPQYSVPSYTISFDGNEPAVARASATGHAPSITVKFGENAVGNGYSSEDYKLSLEGNITAKVTDYNVKVITVTPTDINKSENRKLIERANLIVISQPEMTGTEDAVKLNKELLNIMKAYRNQSQFPAVSGRTYNSTKYAFSNDNDISFAVAKDILKKIAGLSSDRKTCPIVFDYSIMNYVLTKGSSSGSENFESRFSDGTALNLTDAQKKGYSSNLYKLYLMSQQMNPITLYNAYIAADSPISNYSIDDSGKFIYQNGSETRTYNYWNNYTLVPWNTVTKTAWDNYAIDRSCLDVIGVTFDTLIPSGSLFGKINNRLLLVNNTTKAGIASSFTSNSALPKADNPELYEFLGDCASGDVYSVADGILYMLTDTKISDNFNKDLQVLELEPSGVYKSTGYAESFKDESYWFWLISHYVPNYSGKTEVTRMSTSQFIGDIGNVNSKYDILYVGGNDAGIIKDYMPLAPKTAYFDKNVEITIRDNSYGEPIPQKINGSGFSRWENIGTGDTGMFVSKSNQSDYTRVSKSRLLGTGSEGNTPGGEGSANAKMVITYSVLGYVPSDKKDYIQMYMDGSWQYVSRITATYTNPDGSKAVFYWDRNEKGKTGLKFERAGGPEGATSIRQYKNGKETQYGYISIDEYFVKSGTGVNYSWVHYSAKTAVYSGDRIKLDKGQELGISGTDATYVYAHTGRQVETKGNAAQNNKSGSGYLLTHLEDMDINEAATSGNDLTKVKYNALINFLDAGYPVIIGSNLLKNGAVNQYAVDPASYMYDFLTKATSDLYKGLCFYEGQSDAEHDKDFLKALNNKSFDIEVIKQPISYHDISYCSEDGSVDWRGLTPQQVYVNGTDPTARTLEYVFTIASTDTSDTYSARFFVDTNADGKFSESTEMLDSMEICEASSTEPYAKIKNARGELLTAGKTYKLTVNAAEYVGLIPWKIEIVSNKNPLVSGDITGMCAIKAEEKKHAYVLQILPDWGVNIVLPTNKEVEEAKNNGGERLKAVWNGFEYVESGDLYETSNKFYQYTRNLNDFEVEYFRLNVSQFSDMVQKRKDAIDAGWISASDAYWYKTTHTEIVHSPHIERSVYEWGEGSVLYEKKWEWIEAGVWHDRGDGVWTDEAHWGWAFYYVTYYTDEPREVEDSTGVGIVDGVLVCESANGDVCEINMLVIGFADCYTDITNENALNLINEFINSGKATLFTHDTTSPYNTPATGDALAWGQQINKYFRGILKMDRYNVMANAGNVIVDNDTKDWPLKAGTYKNGLETDIGLSDVISKEYSGTKYVLNQGFTNACMNLSMGEDGNVVTKVTKSNDGQITNYPYYVPDEMNVAKTHSQYWQLDFEDDDIVVWYSLSRDDLDPYKTMNDVRNNYYIYNCGNITYTGVGHSAQSLSDYEAKLFVNTMIAAYKAITSPAEPVILNTDKSTNKENLEYLYIDYDETIDPEDSEPFGAEISKEFVYGEGNQYYKRVYFTVKSYSIVLNKTLTVHMYPALINSENGNIDAVYREFPMTDIKIYEYDSDDPDNESLWSEAEMGTDFSFEYVGQDGKDVKATLGGPVVYSGHTYFADIPISDSYYRDLFANHKDTTVEHVQAADGAYDAVAPGNADSFALGGNSSFGICLDIIMRYGRDQTVNRPLSDSIDIVFTRRGLFMID